MKKTINIFLILVLALFSNACTKNKDSADGTIIKKKKRDPNLKKRADEYKGAIIGGKDGVLFGGGQSTAQFAADNMLWRASLQTLNFIPLVSANYSGGVIVTDWYSRENSNDAIKIQVVFKSDELSTNSIEIISHKKICNTNGCRTTAMDQNFNSEIKNKILERARVLNIAKANKEKK
tara:strand:+ start:289 stop:822 length:534 start_codon:yes stop_codon:yes gene_type:complete